MSNGTPQSGRRSLFARLAEYDRPWVGRVGLVLVVILWLLFSLAALAAGLRVGLAVVILGGALIAGEVWLDRNGERHPGIGFVWHSAWNIAAGAVLIGIAVVKWDGWSALIPGLFGAWLILWRLVLASVWLRVARDEAGTDQ